MAHTLGLFLPRQLSRVMLLIAWAHTQNLVGKTFLTTRLAHNLLRCPGTER